MDETATHTCRYCGTDIVCVDGDWLDTIPDDPEPKYCAFGGYGEHRPEDRTAG
jgi:hypothetical protein